MMRMRPKSFENTHSSIHYSSSLSPGLMGLWSAASKKKKSEFKLISADVRALICAVKWWTMRSWAYVFSIALSWRMIFSIHLKRILHCDYWRDKNEETPPWGNPVCQDNAVRGLYFDWQIHHLKFWALWSTNDLPVCVCIWLCVS